MLQLYQSILLSQLRMCSQHIRCTHLSIPLHHANIIIHTPIYKHMHTFFTAYVDSCTYFTALCVDLAAPSAAYTALP
ncbi:hypothetical protein EON63_20335 [archaeon]|nr:MAG: hypothetical protein EON63_20335 [archaeon]